MKEHLPTHTWPERNMETFRGLESALDEWNVCRPVVIDIGPGVAAQQYASQLPVGNVKRLGLLGKAKKKIINAFESSARDNTNNLVCFEVPELYRLLYRFKFPEFYVVDKYDKVIRTVDALDLSGVKTIKADIERNTVEYQGSVLQGDIVIAMNVIHRRTEKDYSKMLDNITSAVRNGGYLVINFPEKNPILLPGFSRLKDNVYWRGYRQDKKQGWGRKAPELDSEAIRDAAVKATPYPVTVRM